MIESINWCVPPLWINKILLHVAIAYSKCLLSTDSSLNYILKFFVLSTSYPVIVGKTNFPPFSHSEGKSNFYITSASPGFLLTKGCDEAGAL